MDILRHKHIVWDWNGTLFDDAWLCRDAINVLLRKRGMPTLTEERYQQVFDFPVMEYYRRLGFDFEKESFEDLGDEFMLDYEVRKFGCRLQDAAAEVLAAMGRAGLTQSILSAYKQDALVHLLEHFAIHEYFTHVIGREDHYASGKIEQGLWWIEQMHLDPADVLLIGDTAHDSEVAAAMGTACCLIPGGNHTKARLETCGVPVFESLAHLLRAIEPGYAR